MLDDGWVYGFGFALWCMIDCAMPCDIIVVVVIGKKAEEEEKTINHMSLSDIFFSNFILVVLIWCLVSLVS